MPFPLNFENIEMKVTLVYEKWNNTYYIEGESIGMTVVNPESLLPDMEVGKSYNMTMSFNIVGPSDGA